jgi:predicted ribosome quality control (RQC) complex YloA/Tae2 family protein
MTASEALRGSRVRRVASLGSRAILLELSAPKGTLVLSVERGAQGIAFVDQAASQIALEPAPWVTTLRSVLDGAQLGGFERIGTRTSRLSITCGAEQLWLVLEWSNGGAWALVRASAGAEPQPLLQVGRVHAAGPAETPEPYEPAASLAELQADGARLVPRLAELELEAHKRALAKRLRTERQRRERRLVAIEQDAARGADAAALRAQASLVLANLHALRGASGEIDLEDFSSDPPAQRKLTIDPKLGARGQCDAWFQRARKLERGAVLAKERAATTQTELSELDALIDRVAAADALAELAPLQDQARRFGIAPQAPSERKSTKAERVPYREFRGAGERVILVGRGAADNDALTLRNAKPHDLWLHARDESGAHVVVPLARNESCPPELLCDAATLAAHFSSARGAERADVIYTPRRYVQKPRKSAVGSVLVLREKVFHLQLEPARLKRLLASEQAPDARK